MDDINGNPGGGFINKVTGKQKKLIDTAMYDSDAILASTNNTKSTNEATLFYSAVFSKGELFAPLPGN